MKNRNSGPKPEIRKMLVLSTAHVPVNLREEAEFDEDTAGWGAAPIVTVLKHGFLLWVPDDPQESSDAMEEATHTIVLDIQLKARGMGCDYVMLDADGPVVDWLARFEEREEATPTSDS